MLWPFGTTWRPVRRTHRGTLDLRWLSARTWTRRWYPQGIDVGQWNGRRTLAVSWFRQRLDGQHLASRIAFVDLDRSRHLDVLLAVEEDGELRPAVIHAGGLAWFGDRVFVAATGRGIWEFDLRRVRRVRGADARRVAGSRGRGLRATALVAVRVKEHPIPLRCSFVGRAFAADGAPLDRVLIGEYRGDEGGRIAEFTVPAFDAEDFREVARFAPGVPQLQGAVRWGDRHFLSQSDGLRRGTLWTGGPDSLAPDRIPLPVGCEDLALDPEGRLLWTLGEHPWKRIVRGIPFGALRLPG